jgi:hypothetical protein
MVTFEVWVMSTGASGTVLAVQTGVQPGTAVTTVAGLGFAPGNAAATSNLSGSFDTTVANSIVGISVNTGASAAWTIADLFTQILP